MRDTLQDLIRERNSLRLKLWDDPVFAHRYLCHADGGPCLDGCDSIPNPTRAALYNSEIEDTN